ncbi:lactate utilization protein, partial [Enterococcus faecium]
LYCIRCGSCLNVCPIYQNIGGHTYETTYQGPIGSLISPHLSGMKEFKHLSYASSLCGKCTEVCPVGIDIQKMLLLNRRDAVQD